MSIPQVTRFEANLLRLARFLAGDASVVEGPALLQERFPQIPCLSATAIRLLEQTLAVSIVRGLTYAGGWRVETQLADGRSTRGRVWERHTVATHDWTVSSAIADWLLWATTFAVDSRRPFWNIDSARLTAADEYLLFRSYEHIRTDAGGSPVFARNALCRLAYPADFADAPEPVPDFAPWMHGARGLMLECLQSVLAETHLAAEKAKRNIPGWETMRKIGLAERAVRTAFLDCVERANRPDLAGYLLTSLPRALRLTPSWAGEAREAPARLEDRLTIRRLALTGIEPIERLTAWRDRARRTSYLDEDYAIAQHWLTRWESADGEKIAADGRETLRATEPLWIGRPVQEMSE